MPNIDRPTTASERLVTLDAVRGFALLGIVVVNATLFFWPIHGVAFGEPHPDGPLDAAAAWLMRFAFEGKFFTLFSLLFGIGVSMQLARGWPARRVVRRLAWLALIGAAHVTLLWFGDILLYYGVLGLVLVAARKASPRRLVTWSALLLLVPVVLTFGLSGLTQLAAGTAEGAAAMEQGLAESRADMERAYDANMATFQGRDFGAMIAARWGEYGFLAIGTLLNGMLFAIPAMFLLGAAAWRSGWVDGPGRERRWGALLRVSLPVAVVANLTSALTHGHVDPISFDMMATLHLVSFIVGGVSGALSYACGGALLLRDRRAITRAFANVGRLALSNYLLQSLVMTTLALGYGLGLYGRVGYATAIALALLVYLAQVALSAAYLRRFRFGPVEWSWRALTYGRVPR